MCTRPIITLKIGKKVLSVRELGKVTEGMYDFANSNDIVEIPCGKCRECRIQKMLEMKTRLQKELEKGKPAFFLTLTYDEEHKKNLNIVDIQKFLKRYRKKKQCRYFYVGELGETTKRPHYHMILFTELPKDLKESNSLTKKGYKQYESEQITKIWNNGLVRISKMEKPLIGYILKYMLKNNDNKDFVCGWSRRPPIGINEETIEQDIKKLHRTKCLKNFYKYRNGDIPPNDNEIEQHEHKIEEIEKQTGLKYIQYIRQKQD